MTPSARNSRMVPAFLSLAIASVAVSDQAVADSFRVLPYLQSPSSEGMTITWFAEAPFESTLELLGGSSDTPRVYTPIPTHETALNYTAAEQTQSIAGLTRASWLLGAENHKYTVELSGLEPATEYVYTVRLGVTSFEGRFRTAPSPEAWGSIRFVALADSETEPLGRVTRREWNPGALAAGSLPRPALSGSLWASKFGTSGSGNAQTLRYALTEEVGYQLNLEAMASRMPDFIMMPGDLVQGGGYQPAWDEFFRQNAGVSGAILSRVPILPAFGNWENFGALNGGYGNSVAGFGPKRGRDKYHVYFDAPSNGTPEHRDNYYRVDYGPLTIITLDSSKGTPDDTRNNYPSNQRLTGTAYTIDGTDTQQNFTAAQYTAAGGTDLSPFNPGTVQWNWAMAELANARAAGQMIIVQFHHAPFSSGEHGFPMNHAYSTGQGGTPMRVYHPAFEEFGVLAVLCGHSEMFERSFVDTSGDGRGVLYYDVGVAGDGLRGERRDGTGFNAPLLRYNPARQWTADQDEPENWQSVDGVLQLVSGGKHYGHLEVNFERIKGVSGISAQVILSPIHVFPILDSEYNLIRSERRLYRDEVVLWIDEAGRVVTPPMPMPEVDLGVGATLPVPTEGQVMELTISAKPDAGWLVYTDADWISGEPDRGFGDGVVRLTINGNQGSARSASVRIGDATLVLEQMGFFRGMIIR